VRTDLRDARRERPAPQKPAEVPLDARVALAARVGNQGLQRLIARQPPATEAAPIPAWVNGLYAMVGLSAAEVSALLSAAGPSAIGYLTRAYHCEKDPIDARRVNIYKGTSQAAMLDWDKVHPQVSPANPATAGKLPAKYGSLREVFYKHRAQQLLATFGVQSLDMVIGAAEVAQLAGDPVAEKIRDLLFRCNQYAIVETLNVSVSERYKDTDTDTFCNVYAYDLVAAMGGYLPRVWWSGPAWAKILAGAEIITEAEYKRMRQHGEKLTHVVAPILNQTVSELSANALHAWMFKHGGNFGWRQATDVNEGQEAANSGLIVVMLAKGVKQAGHVDVVLAESNEHHARRDPSTGRVVVPLQSTAGGKPNKKYSAEPDPSKPASKWWTDPVHEQGGAWIFEGKIQSPLVTPEEMGATGAVI
jgi:hypothetical protein